MADYKSTKVTRQTSKQFDDGNWSYSFQTEATGSTWVRAGKDRHAGIVEEGNVVDLTTSTAQKRGASSPTTYCDRVSLVTAANSQATKSGFGGSGFAAKTSGAGAGYESNRQSSIEYQSARNAAVEYLKLVVGSQAVKLPEPPAKRLKVMDAMLDAYTAQFYTDVGALGALKRVSQEDEPVAEAATTVEDDE